MFSPKELIEKVDVHSIPTNWDNHVRLKAYKEMQEAITKHWLDGQDINDFIDNTYSKGYSDGQEACLKVIKQWAKDGVIKKADVLVLCRRIKGK